MTKDRGVAFGDFLAGLPVGSDVTLKSRLALYFASGASALAVGRGMA